MQHKSSTEKPVKWRKFSMAVSYKPERLDVSHVLPKGCPPVQNMKKNLDFFLVSLTTEAPHKRKNTFAFGKGERNEQKWRWFSNTLIPSWLVIYDKVRENEDEIYAYTHAYTKYTHEERTIEKSWTRVIFTSNSNIKNVVLCNQFRTKHEKFEG